MIDECRHLRRREIWKVGWAKGGRRLTARARICALVDCAPSNHRQSIDQLWTWWTNAFMFQLGIDEGVRCTYVELSRT